MATARRRDRVSRDYYSSNEKNLVREKYDLPLVKAAARRKDGGIRYFGLPGEDALIYRCWGDLCEYVAAVEFCAERFQKVKHVLRTQFGTIRHRAHLGDVDTVILKNRSGRSASDFVSTTFRQGFGYIWDFDVLYLDYLVNSCHMNVAVELLKTEPMRFGVCSPLIAKTHGTLASDANG